MAQRQTALDNNPDLTKISSSLLDRMGRSYGIILGVLTAVYLLLVNALTGDLPMGLRFAKYLLIVPVVWAATSKLAAMTPEGEAFKVEMGLLFRIAMWAVGTILTLNIILSSINANLGFEQFLNEGDTFGDMMVNSFFMAMETFVMVMIFGFVFMQYYKGQGSPED